MRIELTRTEADSDAEKIQSCTNPCKIKCHRHHLVAHVFLLKKDFTPFYVHAPQQRTRTA